MNQRLTTQNTQGGHVGRTLRSILTEIETRKVSGEPVPPVPTQGKHRNGAQTMITTFDSWLRAQAGRRDAIGDLARDYADDCRALGMPAMTSPQLRARMAAQHASGAARRTLTVAVHEWNQWQYLAETRPRTRKLPLTNANGDVEQPLPTTAAEQE